ncbi:hypothetical protein CFC21_084774 [Triticum aestivum]|uniref:Uncharacterized protein n=3 Tax=Triticum TaxID=4564 RepID=A0A9R0Y8U5_TRITD|nr:uncharacterized protein LOC123131082 [Triticum aestivum]KAF7080747.1 hypothetical protein CFC21_084774 [Triticum aestivum]VAI50139.1 unnamed protein product [Triticum turgidum subsp. durum]
MKRQFVNLVTRNWTEGLYSVRRIDPYRNFFYGSAEAAAVEVAKKKESFPATQMQELPTPSINFESFPAMQIQELPTPSVKIAAIDVPGYTLDMFGLFTPRATSEGRMVYANTMGDAGLYDADNRIHTCLGRLNKPKGHRPMCLSVAHPDADEEDRMYVLDSNPRKGAQQCFEVLERTPRKWRISLLPQWHWRLLSPPPFVHQPGYQPSFITSFTTMVDGDGVSTIYISGDGGIGTYSFETPRHQYSEPRGWSHVGEWMLPFRGRAQYVPEFNLWFGFSDLNPNHLCATDLSAMYNGQQPTAPKVWEDLNLPEGEAWLPKQLELLPLGGGKFLIAKTFAAGELGGYFSLLTGIEMIPGDGGDRQALQMVKHKCARFVFMDEELEWVL